jgi:tetratricopeptide (TPR) repeat protein
VRGSIAIALVLSACTPTISQPRGEAHLRAMREATRHYHHGRIDRAAEAWERAGRAAERRVDRDEAEYRQARAYLRMGEPLAALALLDAIAERRPISRRTIRALFDSALIRVELGETERAHEALRFIVNERPGDGAAGRALAILLDTGAPDEARLAFLRELYERVGESDLGDDILDREAAILRERGDLDGAVRTLERLVRDHAYPRGQRWDDALWRLADIAEERRRFPAAIDYLERMIAIHELTVTPGSQTLPRMPEAILRIARIYRDRLHDPVRAAQSFQRVEAGFPTSRLRDDAIYELGVMWLELGARGEGCAALERVARQFEVGRARRLAQQRIEASCER